MNNVEILSIVERINNIKAVGNRYYKSENDILKRKKTMYYKYGEGDNCVEGIMNDPYKANNTLPSGYFKILVDQKLNYVLGEPFSIEIEEVTRQIKNEIKNIGKEASKNGKGWGYVYVENGEIRLKTIPFEQIYPIYKDEEYGILEKAYRYYRLNEIEYFEIITKDSIEKYRKENNGYILEANTPHIITGMRYGTEITNVIGKGWSNVPIIPMYNNAERLSDLHNIKPFIDIYDIVESDFANNLEDIQDAYWVIKGYNGNNVSELLNNIKQYKAARVGEGGDAHLETQDIPYLAKNAMLDRIEQDIFTYGLGLNTNKVGDGNATNYIIMMRAANLRLKSGEFEQQIQEFMFRLLPFINELYSKSYEIEDALIKFNHMQIINESEVMTALAGQKGIISNKTLLEKHPLVEDVEEEIKRIEDEEDAYEIKEPLDTEDNTDTEE